MADVTALRRRADRGQFMLAFAMVFAVAFVVVALFLNTAIYTENIATRESDVTGAGDAVTYRVSAAEGAAGAVTEINHRNNSSYAELDEQLNETVANWSEMAANHRLRQGRSANVSVVASEHGTRIVQDTDDDFRNRSDDADWALVNGTDDVRAMRLNVTRSSLDDALPGAANFSDPFRVQFHGDGGAVWEVRVYENVPQSAIEVAVVDDTGSTVGTCRVAQSRAVVDITNASLAEQSCPAMEFLDNLSRPLDITYNLSDNAQGTYSLVVSKTGVDGGSYGSTSTHYGAEGSGSHPYRTVALYDIHVEIHYRTARVDFATVVRVAPGEQA